MPCGLAGAPAAFSLTVDRVWYLGEQCTCMLEAGIFLEGWCQVASSHVSAAPVHLRTRLPSPPSPPSCDHLHRHSRKLAGWPALHTHTYWAVFQNNLKLQSHMTHAVTPLPGFPVSVHRFRDGACLCHRGYVLTMYQCAYKDCTKRGPSAVLSVAVPRRKGLTGRGVRLKS